MIKTDKLTRLFIDSLTCSEWWQKMRSRVLFFALVTSALFFSGVMAQAATIIVTSGGNSGGGTLRHAILDAASGDTINFAAGLSTINLTSGELLINKNLTISGPGANLLTVRRSTDGIPADAPGFRIFNIASGNFNVALSGLTITRGSDVNFGGGIFNLSTGAVTITNCIISGNGASSFSGSNTSGGAIYNSGTVTITNSTISGNSVFSSGFTGGASSGGGGISGGTVIARNTIIAKNTAQNGGPDVYGPLSSQGYNLIGNGAGATITPAHSSDQIGTASSPIDPRLGPLQDNGGPTFTHALLNTSPAIDKGGGGTGITTDQRGRPRPVRYDASIPEPAGRDGSDIGAFQVSPVQFDAPNHTVADNGGSAVA